MEGKFKEDKGHQLQTTENLKTEGEDGLAQRAFTPNEDSHDLKPLQLLIGQSNIPNRKDTQKDQQLNDNKINTDGRKSEQNQEEWESPKLNRKKVDFMATDDQNQLGMSMISALSEDSPYFPSTNKIKNLGDLSKKNPNGRSPFDEDDDYERDSNNEGDSQPHDVILPTSLYSALISQFPPNPLLPKSFNAKDDSPRSGGMCKFLKLTKFRGTDHGRSKFREEAQKIEKINFPEGITMKKIFKVINNPTEKEFDSGAHTPSGATGLTNQDLENNPFEVRKKTNAEPQMTAFGELVYSRNGNTKDFITTQVIADKNNQKDGFLEENLLDVKNLLKNATSSQAANGKQAGGKTLVNLQGIDSYYQKKDKFDKTLIFESRFESGNLAASLKANELDYYLALQNDVNTSGNTQWFFFRVSNTQMFKTYRFNMLNLCKPDSLYNEGMKVLVYSEKHAQEKDIGWHRGGTKTAYYANGIKKDGQKGFRTLYTMTFSYEFDYQDDNVYFAYCYPYTYTELVEELNAIISDPIKQHYVQKKVLCETLAGNKCDVLTITSRQNPENMSKRKGVILTARVHPGESVGSWMMKGALDFLVDPDSAEAEYLRQNFVFKVVPMLNPDGVINGNYRCSLAGCDLNRRWKRPSKVLHPTIFATKQLCQQFSKERDLQLFCDFHGHSRRKNIFMYGCNVPGAPEDTRLFPFIMSQICPFFIYNNSRFGNQKSKESTARMALFNELKCAAIYTIESSFCGNDMGPYKNYHFSTNNLMQTGRDFCRTLILYLPIQIPKHILTNFQTNIQDLYNHYKIQSDNKIKPDPEMENMQYYFERLTKVKEANKEIQSKHIKKGLAAVLRQTADIFTDGRASSSAGSDKAPSEDNLELEEIEKVLPVQEDPDFAFKLQKSKTLKQIEDAKIEVLAANKSDNPLKKRNTIMFESKKKIKSSSTASNGSRKSEKAALKKINLDMKDGQIDEIEENDADDEAMRTPNNRDEEKDMVAELKDVGDSPTIHKKRRRRNVESRTVATQTDRSDYMLIKQRQQQKQILAMIAHKNDSQQLENNENNNLQDSSLKENNDFSQKIMEEYLNEQKQGLVNNIINQYNIQQSSPTAKKMKNNAVGEVNFSNYILQQHQNSNNTGLQPGEMDHNFASPKHNLKNQTATDGFSNAIPSASPSKKHRNLVQTRAGAASLAQSINLLTQQQALDSNQYNQANSSAHVNQHMQVQQPGSNLAAGLQQQQMSYMMAQNQQQRVGLSTAQNSLNVNRNNLSVGVRKLQSRQGFKNDDQLRSNPQGNGQVHSKSNANIRYQSMLNNQQKRTANNSATKKQQGKARQNVANVMAINQQTHWQKVSTNNHELTKLFYQLPGGTKNLVSNAIQSQNKPMQQNMNQQQMMAYQPQNQFGQSQQYNINQNKTSINSVDKHKLTGMVTPEIGGRKHIMTSSGQGYFNQEQLPNIQHQLMESQTPMPQKSKSVKRVGGQNYPQTFNNSEPTQKYQNQQQRLFLFDNQPKIQIGQSKVPTDTSLSSQNFNSKKVSISYTVNQKPQMSNFDNYPRQYPNTSKKPPIKSKLTGASRQNQQLSNSLMPKKQNMPLIQSANMNSQAPQSAYNIFYNSQIKIDK